jgi:hypothetical protein
MDTPSNLFPRFITLPTVIYIPSYASEINTYLSAFAKLLSASISFVVCAHLSVRVSVFPYGTTWLPPGGFS